MAQTGSVVERIQSASDYFKNPTLTSSAVILLLSVFAAVLAAMLIARFILKHRLAKAVYIPAADIREHDKMLQVLDMCITRRNKLEFKIVSRQNSGQIVSGMPETVRNEQIIVAMSVPFSPNQEKLTGEKVHCYFKVQEGRRTVFFNFLSNIDRARAGADGFLELAIALPEMLVAGQKRNFLRLDPPDDFILEIGIWPEYVDSATDWKTALDEFPDPILANGDRNFRNIRIRDISAGGTRLIIDKAALDRSGLAPAKGVHFMLQLSLWDPAEQTELPLWMICRIQKYVSTAGEPKADIGVQFIAWSQIKNPEIRQLAWTKLDQQDDEVLPLGNWVAKRYLEEYRKHLAD